MADEDDLREALHDLYMSCSEQDAIGGGPGWQERYRAAKQKAADALGLDEVRE